MSELEATSMRPFLVRGCGGPTNTAEQTRALDVMIRAALTNGKGRELSSDLQQQALLLA